MASKDFSRAEEISEVKNAQKKWRANRVEARPKALEPRAKGAADQGAAAHAENGSHRSDSEKPPQARLPKPGLYRSGKGHGSPLHPDNQTISSIMGGDRIVRRLRICLTLRPSWRSLPPSARAPMGKYIHRGTVGHGNGCAFAGPAYSIYRISSYKTQTPEGFIPKVCYPVTRMIAPRKKADGSQYGPSALPYSLMTRSFSSRSSSGHRFFRITGVPSRLRKQ